MSASCSKRRIRSHARAYACQRDAAGWSYTPLENTCVWFVCMCMLALMLTHVLNRCVLMIEKSEYANKPRLSAGVLTLPCSGHGCNIADSCVCTIVCHLSIIRG